MNFRKYNTDPKLLLERGKAIMASSDDARFLFRVFAVNMVLSGCKASHIGAMAGVTKAAVTGWVKAADEKGFDALRTKSRPGRPAKLSEGQLAAIDAAIQGNPADYGLETWDGPSLSSYIRQKFGVSVSVRQCQRLFRKLGYSLIRPRPYLSKGYRGTVRDKAGEIQLRDDDRFHSRVSFGAPCANGQEACAGQEEPREKGA